MIKKIAWDMFKNTGNINTFLEIENAEKGIQEIQKITKMNVKNIENINKNAQL